MARWGCELRGELSAYLGISQTKTCIGNNMNMNEDKFARLEAIAAGEAHQDFPSKWTYDVKKPLIGTIKGFSSFEHNRFGKQETVIVELRSGEMVSAILNGYLSEGMKMQRAEVDDRILIKYLGKDTSRHGNSHNRYKLYIEK